MAKTKEKTFLEYVESALASALPSNVSSYERMKGRPALESVTKNLRGGSTTRLALENRGAGNTQVARPNTQLAKPNTAIVADRPMRDVTPRGGGAAPLVGATLSAPALVPLLLGASTTMLGDATVRKEGDIQDIIAKFGETMASENRATENRARLQAEEDAQFDTPRAESAARERVSAYRETGGSQRSPLERQMPTPPEPQYRESVGNQRGSMDRQMVASDTAPPKALVVSEPKSGKPMAGDMTPEDLFAVVHGGPFDPKSDRDRKKMAAITELRSREGAASMTPNKFALTIYRTTK